MKKLNNFIRNLIRRWLLADVILWIEDRDRSLPALFSTVAEMEENYLKVMYAVKGMDNYLEAESKKRDALMAVAETVKELDLVSKSPEEMAEMLHSAELSKATIASSSAIGRAEIAEKNRQLAAIDERIIQLRAKINERNET